MLRPLECIGVDVIWCDHAIDDSHRMRLTCVDEPSGENQILRARRADQARQPLRPAGAGDDPQQYFWLTDFNVVTDDSQVATQGQLQTATQGVSRDGGDGRLSNGGNRVESILQAGRSFSYLLRIERSHFLDIGSSRENLRTTVDHDGTHVTIIGNLVRRIAHFRLKLERQSVHRGPVEPYGGHAIGDLHPDKFARGRWRHPRRVMRPR